MHRWTTRSLGVTLLLLLTSCAGSGGESSGGDGSSTVLVFAAASLGDAFAVIESAFEASHPGIDIELNVAGSSALREQIIEGAPADVFASANEANMATLIEAGRVTSATTFAVNELQIAVPAGNPGAIVGLEDFERQDLLIGLCAAEVPCGDFARLALASAGVTPSIDTNEPDVRSLLTKIAQAELDAGIVYVTDVLAAGAAVEGIDIIAAHNQQASYPIAVLGEAPNPIGADAFVTFVLSAEGRTILADHGFDTAGR